MKNQDMMQTVYHVEYPIWILSDQINTGQWFSIAGNSPFSNIHLADLGIAQILATHKYTHAYCMCKGITANERTWMRFKAHYQEPYLNW